MNNELITHKNWWKRNWKWCVLSLILIAVLVGFIIISFGTSFTSIGQAYLDTQLYENAFDKAGNNEKVIEILGELKPIDKLAILEGEVVYSNDGKQVNSTIRISGTKGKARMDIVAERLYDTWDYKKIHVRIKSQKNKKETINILTDKKPNQQELTDTEKFVKACTKNPALIADSFDFPVGKPSAKGYYNAQKFQKNNHLGDDWNGVGGGNTDLGDPIYSIANGYVNFAEDIGGGWGNVVRVLHMYNDTLYESVYAHADSIFVNKGDFVKRGTQIATIGTADGVYLAHLHLEIRDSITMDIGPGYSEDTAGYLDPTLFIKEH